MKTITIRLPDVETAMLLVVQRENKDYKDIKQLIIMQIRDEYRRLSGKKF